MVDTMKKTLLSLLFALSLSCGAGAQTPNGGSPMVPSTVPPFVNAINVQTYGASPSASDNATALQNAINAAVTNNQALYIPSASSCYKYTAPLTISGNLSIYGDWGAANWNGNVNVPTGTPPLVGSVLCPTANGSDAIDISGTSLEVNISNIGILFQTTFGQSSTTTGDGFHYIPTGTNQGLSGATWNNVWVYGHDGNHYAFNFQNPIQGSFTQLSGVGGGLLKLFGNSSSANFGNLTFTQLYGQTVVGGSANCVNLSANASQRLNLITFIRPQCIVNNVSGVSPAGNLPTSAQLIWSEDTNIQGIRKIAPDWETNVSSTLTLGSPAVGNDNDWAGGFTTAATINAPSWTINGVQFSPRSFTFNDSTSTGTVPVETMYSLTANHLTASSATTYTIATTLYVPPPVCSTNATCPTTDSIYATGQIQTTSSVTTGNGLFVTGNTQINTNGSTHTTEIGDGTTSGAVTIGGTSNTTNLNSATITATNLATDATHTDRTVCQDTTSKSLFFGSGTAGVCLGTSSARFKHNIADLTKGLDQIMNLRPVSYEYNADHGDPNHVLYGFTAEDMDKALPQLVGLDSEGKPNSADYLGVVPVLVKAIQEQQKEITSLKAANDNHWCLWKLCLR